LCLRELAERNALVGIGVELHEHGLMGGMELALRHRAVPIPVKAGERLLAGSAAKAATTKAALLAKKPKRGRILVMDCFQ